MNELALFSGAGGGILGGHLIGWRTVCAVEWEPYPASVLIARQNEGVLANFPIWDDVRTFDGHPWRGRVDVVSGGFPCQDISSAGKGAGIDGERSGMWAHMARIIGEVRPKFAFVENSPLLTKRGLHRVLGDLAALGYDARWGVLGARDAGAPHKRDRIWIVAHANGGRGHQDSGVRELWTSGAEQQSQDSRLSNQTETREISEEMADTTELFSDGSNDYAGISARRESLSKSGNRSRTQDLANSNLPQCKGGRIPGRVHQKHANPDQRSAWWDTDPADAPESGVGRVADGVAARVDRLKAIGNGQVPSVAALAWETLSSGD